MHELIHVTNDTPPGTYARYSWKVAEIAGADAAMKAALELLGPPELSSHVSTVVVSVSVTITQKSEMQHDKAKDHKRAQAVEEPAPEADDGAEAVDGDDRPRD